MHMLKPRGKLCQFTYNEEVYLASRFDGFYELVDHDLKPETSKERTKARRYLQVYNDFFFGVIAEFTHHHRSRRSSTRGHAEYERKLKEDMETWFWDQYEWLCDHEETCSGCE